MNIIKVVWKTDILRFMAIFLIASLAALASGGMVGWTSMIFAGGSTLLLVFFAHIVRRILFPYLDLKVFILAIMDSDDSTAKSIIVFSVVLLIVTVLSVQTAMLL